MPYEVLRTRQVRDAVKRMTRTERRRYEAVRDDLRGRGCQAGGYRLAADTRENYPLCCRHLANAWRLYTAYPDKRRVIIVAADKHTPTNNPAATLAEILPGIATIGRRRRDKPACCDSPAAPPAMNEPLRKLLEHLF